MVKPTAAIASTAAVTRPKPSEARNRLIGFPLRDRAQLRGGDVAGHMAGTRAAVGVDLEDAGRVANEVEVGGAARAFVAQALPLFRCGDPWGNEFPPLGARRAVANLGDERR